MVFAPLPLIIPLLAAAMLVFISRIPLLSRRQVADSLGIATAVVVTGLCVVLLVKSSRATIVYWFGNWRPEHGIALGISFTIDPIGAGLAALVGALVTGAFIFSWRYFDAARHMFHVLMLVFLGAMCGFCLSGDLFDIFVFFELMGVAAFALTGYHIEEQGPVQGALNFAILNSIAAYLILTGIGLLYARTGALNLAQIGHTLAHQRVDNLIIIALTLIVVGFFVKAAIVPFHFWLADAHAVAPAPVCVLFSGVMVELGLYAVFRIYWTVFQGTLATHEQAVRAVLVGAGVVTMLLGAVMCVLQRHLKRLLAYSTISHVGIFTVGAALLTPLGLAGSAVYVLAHAMIKGSLFLCTGILLHRLESVDELKLHGKGRQLPITGILFLAGGLGLSCLPPFGTYLGKGMIEDSAEKLGYTWVTVALIIASALTGAAVLRATGRVFMGWGPSQDLTEAEAAPGDEKPEQGEEESRTPWFLLAPAIAMMLIGFAIGLQPGLGNRVEVAAARFEDRPAYTAAVLPAVARPAPIAPLEPANPTPSKVVSGLVSWAGALGFALFWLFRERIPEALRGGVGRAVALALKPLRAVHSGTVGDYVTWLAVGFVGLAVAFAYAVLGPT